MLWDKELWDCRSSGTPSSVSGRKVWSNQWVECPSYHLQESSGNPFIRQQAGVCVCVHVCICMYVCVCRCIFLTSKYVYVFRFLFSSLKTQGLWHNWKNSSIQQPSDRSRHCLWDRIICTALCSKCMHGLYMSAGCRLHTCHLFLNSSIINL